MSTPWSSREQRVSRSEPRSFDSFCTLRPIRRRDLTQHVLLLPLSVPPCQATLPRTDPYSSLAPLVRSIFSRRSQASVDQLFFFFLLDLMCCLFHLAPCDIYFSSSRGSFSMVILTASPNRIRCIARDSATAAQGTFPTRRLSRRFASLTWRNLCRAIECAPRSEV